MAIPFDEVKNIEVQNTSIFVWAEETVSSLKMEVRIVELTFGSVRDHFQ